MENHLASMTSVRAAVLALAVAGSLSAGVRAENIIFPSDANLIDMTAEPYSLKGDGKTDNAAALQKAFDDLRGKNLTFYFPNGTYLFSDAVGIFGGKAHSNDRFVNFQGQSEAGVVLKLKDNASGFDNADKPKVFISLYEGQSTGDWMHGYLRNFTVDIGAGNPGAAAIRYMSNNSGAIYDMTVRSSDPEKAGAIGLDLRQSQVGPCLIKRVTVDGFDHGIETGNSFSIVFEHINLSNQRKIGFLNHIARSSMRGLTSKNSVPAVVNDKHGELTLIEANLTGGAKGETAITSDNAKLFLRDITVDGYGKTVTAGAGKSVSGNVDEWMPGQTYALLNKSKPTSLRLPIEETPDIPWETDLSKWQKVELTTADNPDSIQKAFDEAAEKGCTTVYFPKETKKSAKYLVTKPIRIHGSVNRVLGMENILWIDPALPAGESAFIIEDLKGPLVFGRFFNLLVNNGWKGLKDRFLFENKSDQPIILANFSHGAGELKKPQPGKTWFIEDLTGNIAVGKGEKVWARHLNPESPKADMVTVDGGMIWILGLKTEGRARTIVATNGAKAELLGGTSYQSWKNQDLDPPMFTVVDSEASFTIGFYYFKLPFTTIVSESQKGVEKTLLRKDLKDGFMPLYRSGGSGK